MIKFKDFLESKYNESIAYTNNFPSDFEKTLNLIVEGTWTIIKSNKLHCYSNFLGDNKTVCQGIVVEYRGMSQSGRHYKMSIALIDSKFMEIKKEKLNPVVTTDEEKITYNAQENNRILFLVDEIIELGKDHMVNYKMEPIKNWLEFKQIRHLRSIDLAKQIKEIIDKWEIKNEPPKELFKPGQTIIGYYHDEDEP